MERDQRFVFILFNQPAQVFESFVGQVLLGGRAAEEVIFGRDTSRASLKYLEDATCLARKMLTM